jgi:HEAT repeat protein
LIRTFPENCFLPELRNCSMTRRILLSFFVLAALTSLRTIPVHAVDNPPDDFVKMIVRLIGDSDREFRAAGLEQVRSAAKGPAATKIFADQVPKLDAGGQVALLHALADRGDVSARAHVLDLLNTSQDVAVRSAALSALGTLGGPDDLPLLIKTLSATSSNEQSAARKSLVQLGGDAISSSLAAESRNASPSVRTALIDVLATRRASEVSSIFIDASIDENAQVRAAAMAALGQIGQPEQIGAMLPGVLKAQKGGERDNAERQVVQVCSRIENEDQRGVRLIEALNKVPVTERDELLPLVGRVGGKKLIGFVAGTPLAFRIPFELFVGA